MSNLRYSLGVLSDPTVFAMGRLSPVSDHDTYASEAEASMDASSPVSYTHLTLPTIA